MNTNRGHSPIRILAVDDHPLFREGLTALIKNQDDLSLVAIASDGNAAVEQFRLTRPDITLMDLQMPGMSGIDAIIAIRTEFPAARIVVVTTHEGDVPAQRALKAGAQAYVMKSLARKDLLETIRAVHHGMKRISPDVANSLANHTSDEGLTIREVQVLGLIAAGLSNKVIGGQLAINEETVKGHVKHILLKLGARDRTHAATVGVRRGIIPLEPLP